MKSIFINEKTLDGAYFKILYELFHNGRKNKIDSGSYEGCYRLEGDFVAGTIEFPNTRPLAPQMPEGVPPTTTDDDILNYFINYIMDGENLEENEHYRYATWINGGNYKMPKISGKQLIGTDGSDMVYINIDHNFTINVPSQVDWVIKHYKEKGFGNNHCFIQIGYPESSFAYDIPYKNDMERQTSPCVLPDTNILTINGNIKAKDIKVGDIVLTHKGNWKKVVKLYKRKYKGNICNIRIKGFNENLRLTEDHPINSIKVENCPYDKSLKLRCKPNCSKQYSCYEKNGRNCKKLYKNYKHQWIDAKNIDLLCYIPFPKIKQKKKCPYTKEEMYLFGLFLAEGDYHGGLRFNLGSHENYLIDKLKKLMKKVYNLDPHISLCNENNSAIRLSFYSMKLERKYKKLFFSGARNKDIPMDFIYYDVKYLNELLDGYIDGDGYIRKTKERSFYTSSKKLRDKFLLILNKVNDTFTVSKRNVKDSIINDRVIRSNGSGYNIEIKKDKKQNIFWQDNDYMYFPIHYNKKEYYEGDVYNYEVEDDNSYIANNISVHNCLRGIDTHIKDNKLHAAVYFRSWDAYGAWPENMGGIVLLMEYIANELNIEVGPLSFASLKLHCYDFQIDAVKARLMVD